MKVIMAKTGINIDIFGKHSCQTASTSSRQSVMAKSGINIDLFGAYIYSCRSASTSSIGQKGVMIDKIMKTVGRSTFSINFFFLSFIGNDRIYIVQ